ncbi:hypothetical protein PR048_010723 [Dryococelus australis]|uniref:Uncharacterized protein n=1 Tax=Dryococelus australis TaxID=614101 RepID=A0ABQ9I3I2_9NEOP|nr:hypothetical protein PR048_010723 [Dryococelus australis]
MPNVRMYWNDSVDPQANGFDKLHKLPPVLDKLGERFLSVLMEEYPFVDEQICTSRAQHHLKQYMALKPLK